MSIDVRPAPIPGLQDAVATLRVGLAHLTMGLEAIGGAGPKAVVVDFDTFLALRGIAPPTASFVSDYARALGKVTIDGITFETDPRP